MERRVAPEGLAGLSDGFALRAPSPAGTRPRTAGRFLFAGEQKLCVRGTTYGTFAPSQDGDAYPARATVARDFAQMASHGFNAVRTYTTPPPWLLDVAAEHGLYVLAGIAWEQHVDFLEERRRARAIEDRVRAAVLGCAGHPALLGHAVANEIPSQIVRWLGRRRVERFIARLYRAAKAEDPEALVTYVNYPPTEYLQLPFLDLNCFNVYLEDPAAYEAYLARLQNLSGELPLVMAEIGLDSRAHGESRQAAVLARQVDAALRSGCAGAFVFAWTDDWYVSYLSEMEGAGPGAQIEDWDFGLTDRARRPKPALRAVRTAFRSSPSEWARRWPRVSVVVCTYNGERTIRACLEGLSELDYPDYEVIVVNDGSTDATLGAALEYPVRVIDTENRGLAAARNTGMRAADGEIVAYLDDDARPDRDWLRHLALALQRGSCAGVGGPNVPPAASSMPARCLAEAPGTPIHVLLSDTRAEHIPGCNMAFRKRALEEVGGFDQQFRIAGDDVDLCWRLLDAGHALAFSPAAMVWHRPRGSIRAYLRQQREYGRAEALLERKWPERYRTGQASWSGRLYARGSDGAMGKRRVRYGTWGSELFQSLYSSGGGALASLPSTPEWHLWLAALLLTSLAGLAWTPLLAAAPLLAGALAVMLLAAGASAARCAAVLRPGSRRARAATWALMTILHLLQPLARARGRLPARAASQARGRPFAIPLPRRRTEWTEDWQPARSRLREIEAGLRAQGAVVVRGGEFDRWDLDIRRGRIGSVRLHMGVEEHGAGRQLVRLRLVPRCSYPVAALIGALAGLAVVALTQGGQVAAIVLLAGALALCSHTVNCVGRALGSALRQLGTLAEGDRPPRAERSKVSLGGTA